MTYETPYNHNPYHTASRVHHVNEFETLQQLMDQKRELVSLSLCLHAVGKLSAQAAE